MRWGGKREGGEEEKELGGARGQIEGSVNSEHSMMVSERVRLAGAAR